MIEILKDFGLGAWFIGVLVSIIMIAALAVMGLAILTEMYPTIMYITMAAIIIWVVGRVLRGRP